METQSPSLAFLKNLKDFSGLDDSLLGLLQNAMRRQTFARGERLCNEGEPGDRLYVIETGKVSVMKRNTDGIAVTMTVLQPGEIAGEMSLYGQTTRSATLKAVEDTSVWVLEFGAFHALLEQHGALAKALLSNLSRHLREETIVASGLLAREEKGFKVAFFDSKPYSQAVFRENNRFGYAIQFFESRLTPETVSLAAGFNAVCAFVNDQLDAQVISNLKALGVDLIALRCAGYNQVDLAACQRHGISVTHVPAYSPFAVAEHAAALMLALNRRIHQAHNRVREGNFSLNGLVGFDMHAKTAGVVGTGKIGKCLLQILAGFGCRLLAYDVYPDNQFCQQLGARYTSVEELFREADIISLHAPLTPQTRHLVNAATIATMKRGVMLINTSRGALVDTPALIDGLKSGQIGYAGLDVYEEESAYFYEDLSDRIITDDVLARLTTFNNVLITSHQAFLTREALANIAETTFASMREFEQGKRLAELTCRVPFAAK